MRPIVQILRFYTIAKFTGFRTMENILQMPSFNPLLKLCVDTVKRYPDWALEECDRISDSLDNHTFRFNSGNWAMDIREEDVPKGTTIDWNDMHRALQDIKSWIKANRKHFAKDLETFESL